MIVKTRPVDPYRDWLGIQDGRRPLGLYELLRLAPFERDLKKIAQAAKSATDLVTRKRSEVPADVWYPVLAEIEKAAATLTDPREKAAYDAQLRISGGGGANGHGLAPSPAAPASAGSLVATTAADSAAHGPPAHNLAALAGLITCPECHRASPQDRKFCPGCGHSLWEPCVKCGTLCAAGERFCGSCGTNLQSSFDQEASKVEAQIAQAKDLFARGHFAESQRILKSLAKLENKRLAGLALEANRLAEQFRAEWKVRETTSVDAYAAAQDAFDQHEYDRAVELLEQVTATLRAPPMLALLESARGCREEIATLNREIQVGLATQRHLEVLPKAERLLVLEPTNDSVRTLIGKIGQKLMKASFERLQAYRYDEALALLDQVPACVRDEAYAKQRDQAAEFAFLATALRQLPFCDKLLVGIAERLLKAAPGDESTKRIYERMQQMLAAHAKRDKPLAPPAWAKPPEKTPFEVPVDALFGFRRLTGRSDVLTSEPFVGHAAQFHTAAGLALQGLGKARVQLNLMPAADDDGFLASFGGFLGRQEEMTGAWGLDLTGHSLKAIKLAIDPETGEAVVEAIELVRPSEGASRPANEAELRSLKKGLLEEFLARRHPKATDRICVGLPGSKILGRFIELPPVPADKVGDAVRYEAPHQIPFPLEELHWGYHLLGDPALAQDANEPIRVVLVAAKKLHAAEHLALFQEAGLKVDVLASDCVALHNLAVYDILESEEFEESGALLLVDVGSESANFVVSTPHDLFFRSVNGGGNEATAALVRAFKLTAEQADKLKRNPALAKRVSKVYEALDPLLADLAGEIRRTISAYKQQPVRHIYGLGGGFQLPGLLRHLRLKG